MRLMVSCFVIVVLSLSSLLNYLGTAHPWLAWLEGKGMPVVLPVAVILPLFFLLRYANRRRKEMQFP